MIAKRSSSPQRNMKSFYCLRPTRGVYLHTAKSTRRYGEISPLAARATLSAFTSAIYGKSCTRQLPMLPSTSDPSGKSDTALKYKQKNEMNSNQLPDCCSFQTVDKVPGLHRSFSIVVINISMILPVFIKKNPLLINSKVKRCVLCTWYNYPIRRACL